jgi:23S rRNA (cytosine1962-C5)-methyltransferase
MLGSHSASWLTAHNNTPSSVLIAMAPRPRRPQRRPQSARPTFPKNSPLHSGRSSSDRQASPFAPPHAACLSPPGSASLAGVVLSKPTNHPTVYRKRIQQILGQPQTGDWVGVYHAAETSGEPQLFAYGLFNPKSEVAVRIVRWSTELPDERFWDSLIDRAVRLRTTTLGLDQTTTAYRVLHAEADGFPGLVVDRYANCLSAEVFSIAMAPRVEAILQRLALRLGTEHWLIQPSPHLESQEGFSLPARSSPLLPTQVVIEEQGTRYRVHFGTGHKTGFFCDQRDNRRQLTEFCRGRTVLDVCCYTGGFAIMAASRGGASEVTGIDLDEAPLQFAKQNANLNQVQIKFTQADAFAYMRDMLRSGKFFDVVVLDPPKLIRNRSELEEGTRKHFDLNRLAMQLVAPGGLMLTCTCAGLLPEAEFTRLVRSASRTAFLPSELNPNPTPRSMQILARTGAAMCHPVSANCAESEYLKALWLRL